MVTDNSVSQLYRLIFLAQLSSSFINQPITFTTYHLVYQIAENVKNAHHISP